MRQHGLIQRRRREPRRRRPGFFRVTRPAELWHMDMTAIWVAEHGWCYLNAIIDCCTREIVGWGLEVRCRAVEAMEVIERAAASQSIAPGMLTLGTDNGSGVHRPQVPRPAGEARDRPPLWWLPRSTEPGVHPVVVPLPEGAGDLAQRARDDRPSARGDRRPPRPPRTPPPPGARPPHAQRR